MRKFAFAAFALLVSFGLAAGEEFRALITKVDSGKVTFFKVKGGGKGKKAEKDGDAMTLPVADSVKIVKGKFSKEDKKLVAGDALEGGLKNEAFTKGEVNVRITTSDDGKSITQIMTFGFGGFDKKKKKKDAE
jgi:hypothetical protein